ncbi:Hint domain-containing protein, partial [Acidisoma silvae]
GGGGPSGPFGPSGGGAGDTHITTFNGLHYDFQAAGEFVYAQNADITVQIRLEPGGGPQHPSGAVTYIVQTAIGLGTDRLTFDFTRTQPFWLNGAPVTLISGQFLPLAGGTVYATASGFVVQANTGEEVKIGNESTSVFLDGHTTGVAGLLGLPDSTTPQNLTLPDGTVLPTTLTADELYKTYADAWRVTQATSLFDYGVGESTATYTIPGFPEAPVTLADLPPALVQQATEYVASLGITNATQQQDAVLDYLLTGGSQTTLDSDAANSVGGASTSTVQVTSPPVELVGITGPIGPVSIGTGTVNVTFQVFLNNPSAVPVVVTYAVPTNSSANQLGAADFGGTLPSGTVTIAPGATSATITIAVPGNLRLPVETLQLAIATATAGVTLANASGAATLDSSVPIEGSDAQASFAQISGPGVLTQDGTAFTLNLGTIGADGVAAMNLAIANIAASYGNTLAGTFATATGSGFTIVKPSVTGLLPGGVAGGLSITAGTALGQHTETLTFNPTQTNSSNFSGKLAPITLTIIDNVISPIAQPSTIPATLTFDARVGGASTGSLTFSNTSPIGSDSLGILLSDSGGHFLPVQTAPLAPGASATLSLNSLATTSGTFTDTLNVAYSSVPPSSTGHPTVAETGTTVALTGTVYLPADPVLETTIFNFGTVHQGDAETSQIISLLNAVAGGALSDQLLANISDMPVGLFATGTANVTIDPGETASLGAIGLNTSIAGVVNGDVAIKLTTHDAAQSDATLGTLNVKVEGTVIGNALPDFVEVSGPGSLSGAPGQNQILNLGSIVVKSPDQVIKIAIKNAAAGLADNLTGSLTYTSLGVTQSLGDIPSLAPGVSSGDYEFTFAPTALGEINDVITLTPIDSVIGALPIQTLTIEGDVVACFLRGTHIATPDGERRVETLRIADLVTTASGQNAPIRWIGRRSYNGRFIRRNRDVLPIGIRAGALADGIPHRDLWVSPLHAMLIDGVLIPACELVNGMTVVRAEAMAEVEYFHIELARHDVLLAEGAASESFIDDDSRMMFHNAADYAALYPDAAPEPAIYCAPRVTDGFALEAIRHRLDVRAGLRPDTEAEPLLGYVEAVDSQHIVGWALNPSRAEVPVCLDILVDGQLIAQTLANDHRPDLVAAGYGRGNNGFCVTLPMTLMPVPRGKIDVRRSSDHAALPASSGTTRVA